MQATSTSQWMTAGCQRPEIPPGNFRLTRRGFRTESRDLLITLDRFSISFRSNKLMKQNAHLDQLVPPAQPGAQQGS